MKQTTRRLLLSLYVPTNAVVQFPYHFSELVLPDLSAGGRRSLLHLLQNQGLLHKDLIADQLLLSLGEAGKKALEQEFPALNRPTLDWQGEWQLVLFLSPPTTDKNFRYLRKLLLGQQALSVSRGVYGFPEFIPDSILRELEGSYQGHVLVLPMSDSPKFGSLRPLIMDHFQLPDLISTYSGISTEIDELLKQNRTQERLTDSQKRQLATVLERITESAMQDPGIVRFYFPNTPNLLSVVDKYQLLLKQLFHLN